MAKKTAKKIRTWAVSLIRKHGQFLGFVEAPDREAAEAALEREVEALRAQIPSEPARLGDYTVRVLVHLFKAAELEERDVGPLQQHWTWIEAAYSIISINCKRPGWRILPARILSLSTSEFSL
jgi:hypothetical protein